MLITRPLFADADNKKTENKTTYSVGIVPQYDSFQISRIWSPILEEVEKLTGFKFLLHGAPTIPDFEKEFIEGVFDFVFMNPYHLLIAHESQGYIPLIRDIGRSLQGILVVRKDNPIKTVTELDGEVIAFPAPNALGASLMIRADLNDKFHIKMKPRYVQTHTSVYLNVILGEVMAGGGVQKTLSQQSLEIQDNLRIIYKTENVAPHPFCIHPRIPEDVRQKVFIAFLTLSKSDKGKALLKKIPIKQAGSTSINDYEPLKELKLERFYKKN